MMMDIPILKHWRTEQDEHGIIWLYFDKQGASTNTLGIEQLTELDAIIKYYTLHIPKGIVLGSDKSTFIAGANIEEIRELTTPEKAVAFVQFGQDVVNRFAAIPCPKLAMINGFCLGGGLELSLACDYRIALDVPGTRIGLPEVMLGIVPGWGGTVRLPKLIGAMPALEMIASGKTLRGKAALRAGIIDYLLPEREMKRAAEQIILTLPPKHKAPGYNAIFGFKPARSLLASLMKQQIAKRANPEQYPAPFEAVDIWERYGCHGKEAFAAEITAIEKIACDTTAKNLVRIFFLQEALKELGKKSTFKAKRVHVIGAGTMGGDIAAWCAMQGLRVTLQDQTADRIAPAYQRAADNLKKTLKEPRLVKKYMDLLIPDVEGLGIRTADVVIEAAFENLKVKQEIFQKVEALAPDHCIIATNTSSIPLDEISQALARPSRLVGIHFFNPVAKMQLVEVVHSDKTDKRLMQDAMAFVHQIKKLPLPVRSSPGFLVNRILTPYLLEAVTLFNEGVSCEEIDQAAVSFGMPMGPIELADVVGLDICLSVADHLKGVIDVNIPEQLKEKVAMGKLGKKSKEGFYVWRKGKPVKHVAKEKSHGMDVQTIQNRLILRLVNESMACLREGIVETPDDVDTGVIFGAGFAPFRGGPLTYAREADFKHIQEQLDEYAKAYGERFKPDLGWSAVV